MKFTLNNNFQIIKFKVKSNDGIGVPKKKVTYYNSIVNKYLSICKSLL